MLKATRSLLKCRSYDPSRRHLRIPVLLPLLLVVFSFSQNGCGRGQAELEERVAQLEAATPGVGDVMSGVQLHFAKLYYAARAKNWGLTSFEIGEVKENLEKAEILRPFDNGLQLKGMFQGL